MSNAPKAERKYEGAAEYYSRYRPPYPTALVTVLRAAFRIDGRGQLLDLGSGPGSVAIPVAHLFERVVAMDPETDMLREGRTVAGRAGIENIEWVCGSSEDLSSSLGTFRLVTMGESFHRMDRRRTLQALYELINLDGGVAILGRGMPLPLPPMTPWRAAVSKVVRHYLGEIPLPWDYEPPPPEELHEAYLKRSRFREPVQHSELFDAEWTVESIIGNLYSMSFCNRRLLGERAAAFERDLRSAILAVEPSGNLRGEPQQFFALMGFKR
ncbi:MAG TPA: class I SAM-dependent methyltransferase [Candidatus Binataceae bacterium]